MPLLSLLVANLPTIVEAAGSAVSGLSAAYARWQSAKPADVTESQWNSLLAHDDAPHSQGEDALIAWALTVTPSAA